MSSERLKQLVEQIQKTADWTSRSKGQKAQDPAPAAPAAAPASGAAPTAPSKGVPRKGVPTRGGKPAVGPTQSGGGHGFPASAEVKKMQETLVNFANVASSTDVTAMDGNKEGVMEGKQDRTIKPVDALPNKYYPGTQELQRPDGQIDGQQGQDLANNPKEKGGTRDDKNYLGGNDPFGKFLVQNYIGKDSFTGRQYLNVDVAGNKNRENASMAPSNLRGIIDTIKRVGTPGPKGERTVDGVWQTRTNNALHVVGDLVEAILNLSKDMGVQLANYNMDYLAKWRRLVPETWQSMKSQEEVNQRADLITQHLNAMTKMMTQFNTAVLKNDDVRQFIDQKEAFVSFPQDKGIGNLRLFPIPGVTADWATNPSAPKSISLNDLANLENFKQFVERTGYQSNDPTTLKQILDKVSEKINSKIDLGF